jgi:hypothetical protein
VNWTVAAMYAFASPLWGRAEVSSDGRVVRFGLPVAGRVQLFRHVLARSLVLTTSGVLAMAEDINARALDQGGQD